MRKLTRISFNSANWHHPTGDAREQEGESTYNNQNGFGHEDWLFRDNWRIGDWRYAFIQGANKSQRKLAKDGRPFDVTLFTIQPDKQRRYVAKIFNMEVLSDSQADDALAEFKHRGWHDQMEKEIRDAKGNPSALGAAKWSRHVLNVRFRQSNVEPFPPGTFAPPGDPILKNNRYQLRDCPASVPEPLARGFHGRSGTTDSPIATPRHRRGTGPSDYTPEHFRMQSALVDELKAEFPETLPVCEEDFVDVTVTTPTEKILFEIKSDLEPRTVIRHALGQILEYAYHPNRQHDKPVRLVIVGRMPLSASDEEYLKRLQTEFALPIEYRRVSI